MILDFGEKDHCFTPLRRWFHKQVSSPLSPPSNTAGLTLTLPLILPGQRDTLWAPAPEEVEMLKSMITRLFAIRCTVRLLISVIPRTEIESDLKLGGPAGEGKL